MIFGKIGLDWRSPVLYLACQIFSSCIKQKDILIGSCNKTENLKSFYSTFQKSCRETETAVNTPVLNIGVKHNWRSTAFSPLLGVQSSHAFREHIGFFQSNGYSLAFFRVRPSGIINLSRKRLVGGSSINLIFLGKCLLPYFCILLFAMVHLYYW